MYECAKCFIQQQQHSTRVIDNGRITSLEIRIGSVEPRAVDAALVFVNNHDTDDFAIADPGNFSTKVADVLSYQR